MNAFLCYRHAITLIASETRNIHYDLCNFSNSFRVIVFREEWNDHNIATGCYPGVVIADNSSFYRFQKRNSSYAVFFHILCTTTTIYHCESFGFFPYACNVVTYDFCYNCVWLVWSHYLTNFYIFLNFDIVLSYECV